MVKEMLKISKTKIDGICVEKTQEMLAQDAEGRSNFGKVMMILGIIIGVLCFLMGLFKLGKMYSPNMFYWVPI